MDLKSILTLSQVAEKTATSEQNIQDLISRERIPKCFYEYKKAENKKRGIYIFSSEFLEYYNKNLKK